MAAGVPVLHGVRESLKRLLKQKGWRLLHPARPFEPPGGYKTDRTDDSCEDFKINCLEGAKDYDRETFADTMLTCLEELKAKHV